MAMTLVLPKFLCSGVAGHGPWSPCERLKPMSGGLFRQSCSLAEAAVSAADSLWISPKFEFILRRRCGNPHFPHTLEIPAIWRNANRKVTAKGGGS